MKQTINSRSGFTLIEILVAMFISVIIGGLLLVIMTNSAGLFFKESSKVGQGLNVNDALMTVRRDVKQAGSIASSYTKESTTYNSGATQLVLKVPGIDNSGNMIQDTYDYFIYFQDNNLLSYKVFPDSLSQRKSVDQVLATSVDKIIFEYYDKSIPPNEVSPSSAAKIKVTIVLNQKAGLVSEQTVATSEANLRND